jgi:hypothetical protein
MSNATEIAWASSLGGEFATRRATRLAAHAAEVDVDAERTSVPPAVLAQRFAAVAALVVEAVDAFATAAGILIEADPPNALAVQLKTAGTTLTLRREDDVLVATFAAPSRSDQMLIDLGPDAEEFSPEVGARRVAERWINQVMLAQEGPRR